jgi:hypothetical protein
MKTETMKTRTSLHLKFAATVALAALLFLTGCVVTSVYPFYHAKDVIFDPALLGGWVEADKADGDIWTFEKIDDRTYKLTIPEGADGKTEFTARLFKLKEQLFLDCVPRKNEEGNVPAHYLLRLDALSPQLKMRTLDYDWLEDLVEKHPRAIRHIIASGNGDGGDVVLTADTAELQRFVRKHLKNADAWSELEVMKRQ